MNKTFIDAASIGDQTFIGRAAPDRAGARPISINLRIAPFFWMVYLRGSGIIRL
jgi:hypothetical protein